MPSSSSVDIFVPDFSEGLMVDARVLQKVLGDQNARIVPVPGPVIDRAAGAATPSMTIEPLANTAIFIERLFDHEVLSAYSRRILVPNAEWLSARDAERARYLITEVWHKTRFSQHLLESVFPAHSHRYIGFTSFQNSADVDSWDRFAHFAGKSRTRHTQEIVDTWLQDPRLPPLTLQFFNPAGVSIPRWLEMGNVRLRIGFLGSVDYQAEFRRHGLHLCTSQMEGFGHYINEARAIGAACVTLDAPPMNELIDASTGILIPTQRQVSYNFGIRHYASQASIADAVHVLIDMPVEKRRSLGTRARERYLSEQMKFVERLRSLL